MKKWLALLILTALVACSVSNIGDKKISKKKLVIPAGTFADTLRFLYSLPSSEWPAPLIDSGVEWKELAIVPESPLKPFLDSFKTQIDLGRMLFFDPRLSGSNQISCASCHVPDLSWTDGREKSMGHDQQANKRNAPTILNVWFYKRLFWDGRSSSLQDQAFSPINSEIEMHSDMSEVTTKIRKIKGYPALFEAAFGSPAINAETITEALAIFQKTLVSRKAAFDDFLAGNKTAMSDGALRGLNLFRTKARCMNCHNGPLLSDNDFHNVGLTYYGRQNEDLGLYKFTKKAADVGKFKTPSLRDVIRTRPWMHNGLFDNIDGVINMYSAGMAQPKPKADQLSDTLFPKTDKLIKKLDLTKEEKKDIVEFLNAITTEPYKMRMPKLPD